MVSFSSFSEDNWIVVTEYLPPLQYQSAEGKIIGNMTEIVQSILNEAGLDAEMLMLPWARAEQMALDRPNTLIFSISRTEARESKFHWVGAIGLSDTRLYKLSSNQGLKLDSLDDIHRELIGVKRGDVAATFLQQQLPESNFQVNVTTIDTVRMLLLGRIDLVPSNNEQLHHYCIVLACSSDDFEEVLFLENLEQVLYLAANRSSNPKVLEKLERATARHVLELRKH